MKRIVYGVLVLILLILSGCQENINSNNEVNESKSDPLQNLLGDE